MMTSKERAALRAQANPLEVTLIVGKSGISQTLLDEAVILLDSHELVKGRVLETAGLTAREASDMLCEALGAEGIACVGTKFVIWRKSEKLAQEKKKAAARKPAKKKPSGNDNPVKAGLRAREHYQDQLTVKFANQTLKGVIHPEARKWFDIGAELVDIIGALPKRDERDYGRGDEAFDIIMETAKSRNKMVHVHVDQFNESLEYETEQLCEKTIQHGMQGKVVAIHGISIAAHSRAYRQRLYTLMREADVMMIACPTAWIDTPRSEQIGPMHNSMTPVDELVPAGITVALGTDNVCDAMVPWNAGDMWHEMTTLATGCRFDYFDELVKIATVNGRKAIGID